MTKKLLPIFLLSMFLVGCNSSSSGDNHQGGDNKELTGIEITTEPNKKLYEVGEELDLTGLVVSTKYSDSSKETISDYQVNPNNGYVFTYNDIGTKEIKVTYQTYNASFTVDVTGEEIDNYNVKSISLSDNELFIIKGKRSSSIIVNYVSEEEPTDDEKEVAWASLNENIATIDQYGRVSGVELGDTYITCTTVIGHKRARCAIHVVSSMDDIVKEYQLVEDVTTIVPGDVIVLASNKSGVTASNDVTGRYMHPVNTTFSGDKKKITSLGEDTAEFMVGEGKYGLTLENQYGEYLSALNLKKVCFVNNKGNIDWSFCYDEGYMFMESTSNVPGWMMYNAKDQKFTLYDSSVQIDMFMPDIYRLTIVRN